MFAPVVRGKKLEAVVNSASGLALNYTEHMAEIGQCSLSTERETGGYCSSERHIVFKLRSQLLFPPAGLSSSSPCQGGKAAK